MTTLDEAIKHAKDVAKSKRRLIEVYKSLRGNDFTASSLPSEVTECRECAEDHEQLAEWLEELKTYRERNITNELTEAFENGSITARQELIEAMKRELNPYTGNSGIGFNYEKMCEFLDNYSKGGKT